MKKRSNRLIGVIKFHLEGRLAERIYSTKPFLVKDVDSGLWYCTIFYCGWHVTGYSKNPFEAVRKAKDQKKEIKKLWGLK